MSSSSKAIHNLGSQHQQNSNRDRRTGNETLALIKHRLLAVDMGANASAEIGRRLQHGTTDEMLQNDEFVELLKKASPSLSARSILTLRQILDLSSFSQLDYNPLNTPKLRPLLRLSQGDMVVPNHLIQWAVSSMLSLSNTLIFQGGDQSSKYNFASTIFDRYRSTLILNNHNEFDRIRRRYCVMSFYDLHIRVNAQEYLTARGLESLLRLTRTTDMTYNDDIEMKKNLRALVNRGHHYRNISEAFGTSAALILLPDKISQRLWEDALPLKGEPFQAAIAKLRAIGLERALAEGNLYQKGLDIENAFIHFCESQMTNPEVEVEAMAIAHGGQFDFNGTMSGIPLIPAIHGSGENLWPSGMSQELTHYADDSTN